MRRLTVTLIAAATCAVAVTAEAQQVAPTAAGKSVEVLTAIYARIIELSSEASQPAVAQVLASIPEAKIDKAALAAMRPNADTVAAMPKTLPKPTQVQSPSGARARTTLVNAADFPAVIGMAVDNDLLKFEDASVTFDLNLFAFASLANPVVLDRQSEYSKSVYHTMRRFGGAITIGGKGESFDRDGDGEADAALTAEGVTDIFSGEIRWRFHGSRDRRDDVNLQRYLSASGPDGSTLANLASDLQAAVVTFVAKHVDEIATVKESNSIFADAKALQAFLTRSDISAELAALVPALTNLNDLAAQALRAIDGAPIWTVVTGGTHRKAQYGPNKWYLGLRGQATTRLIDHAVNVDFLDSVGLADAADSRTWKAGYQASVLLLRNTTLTQDGISASLSATAEYYQNAPTAKHDTVVRSGFKLEFPLSDSAKLPISINYANHRDLLTDQSEVIGHVGITFDFSGLKKKSTEGR